MNIRDQIAAARALADAEEIPFNRLTDLGQALRQRDEARERLARACELLEVAEGDARYNCRYRVADEIRAFLAGEVKP